MSTFGDSLKHWRSVRGMSQAVLGEVAEVSTRHISFLENRKSTPSRQMVLILANALSLPLRERNVLLEVAGFAQVYAQSPMGAEALKEADRALSVILTGMHPNPCVVVDGGWDLVRANEAAMRLMVWLYEDDLPQPPMNLVTEFFRPDAPLRKYCSNFEQPGAWVASRLARDAVVHREVKLLWDKVRPWAPPTSDAQPSTLVPVNFLKGGTQLRFFTTLTTFSATEDVTLQELKIETYFPADDATRATLASGFLG